MDFIRKLAGSPNRLLLALGLVSTLDIMPLSHTLQLLLLR